MSENDWNVTKPIDHTKIGAVPQKIRDVKSSAKIIIAKEHETPTTDNAGGQHLKGAARVYLQSGLPSLDPEGNALDIAATTDDGRLSVNTAESNTLRVYVGTSAGVSSGWENVRVARVKASEDLDANSKNIVNIASGTVTGQAIHVGQVDTRVSTGQLKVIEPATGAYIAVSVLDPPTEDGHIGSKKYVDAQDAADHPTYSGGESHTDGSGLIMKSGKDTTHTGNHTGGILKAEVAFGTAFPNAITCVIAVVHDEAELASVIVDLHDVSAAGFHYGLREVSAVAQNMSGVHWMAVGY